MVATGRHVIDVRGIRQTLGFDCDLITANGALVLAADDRLLFHRTLTPEIADDLLVVTRGRQTYDANVYMQNGWYVEREMPEWLEFHKESGFVYTLADFSKLDRSDIHKICFTGNHEALIDLEHELLERYPRETSIVFSTPECLEVMAENVNKGTAAREILAVDGLGIDDAIAFGDGMNDFELLSMAAKGFLMENATARLKEALPDNPVAPNCDDDGVARCLVEIFDL